MRATGDVQLPSDPDADLEAATKQYVDQLGLVDRFVSGSNSSSGGAEIAWGTITATLESGRKYRVIAYARSRMLVAADDAQYYIWDDGTQTGVLARVSLATGDYGGVQVAEAVIDGDGAEHTLKGIVKSVNGNGDAYALAGSTMILEDVGPT